MYGLRAMPKPQYYQKIRVSKFEEKTGFSDKILIPGYVGEADQDELQAIYEELVRLSSLRKKWKFKEGEEITFRKIQLRCGKENGTEN